MAILGHPTLRCGTRHTRRMPHPPEKPREAHDVDQFTLPLSEYFIQILLCLCSLCKEQSVEASACDKISHARTAAAKWRLKTLFCKTNM